MLIQFLSVGLLMLTSLMLPGPDFALVSRNTMLYSRSIGLWTCAGVTAAVSVHMVGCLLGLAVIISKSHMAFMIIKCMGAAYLVYTGVSAIRQTRRVTTQQQPLELSKRAMTPFKAFRQGFLCDLLNPKAILFFLAMFTIMIKPGLSLWIQIGFALEMIALTGIWFSFISYAMSHQRVLTLFNKTQRYMDYAFGFAILGFGIALAFV